MNNGFPNYIVLADSWFGIGPFVKKLFFIHNSSFDNLTPIPKPNKKGRAN
jgi:hypothetical protein